jgi:hypothetical protein
LTYNTSIHNPLYILLRREIWANTTSLTFWYGQTLLNPATCYWSACTRPGKWAVIYLYVRGIDFAPFCDFGIVRTMWYFWNCSDNVVFLELFGPCSILGIVRTMSYFWNCSDNVVFLELFGQCSIFLFVRTMWYFWNCLDNVVFLELFGQFLFFILFKYRNVPDLF